MVKSMMQEFYEMKILKYFVDTLESKVVSCFQKIYQSTGKELKMVLLVQFESCRFQIIIIIIKCIIIIDKCILIVSYHQLEFYLFLLQFKYL